MMETSSFDAPHITLTNGVRLANFSSPHPFNFTDGSILAACHPDRVAMLSLVRKDVTLGFSPDSVWRTVRPVFEPSPAILAALAKLEDDAEIDIIIVPLPVLQAMQVACGPYLGKGRTIIVAERDHGEGRVKLNCINCFGG